MEIIIERANSKDAQDILELTKAFGKESDNLTYGEEGISIPLEDEIRYLDSLKEDDKNIFLVAKYQGKIIATGNYRTFVKQRMSHRGELGLSVLKKYWNKGVGSQLLKAILDFAKENAKAEIVSLEVRSDNQAAIHLYEKFGFKKIGTFKGYFKINNQLVDFDIMELIL